MVLYFWKLKRVLKPESLKTPVVAHSYYLGASSAGHQSQVLLCVGKPSLILCFSVWKHCDLFTSVGGTLGCLQSSAVPNSAAVNFLTVLSPDCIDGQLLHGRSLGIVSLTGNCIWQAYQLFLSLFLQIIAKTFDFALFPNLLGINAISLPCLFYISLVTIGVGWTAPSKFSGHLSFLGTIYTYILYVGLLPFPYSLWIFLHSGS